MILQLQYRDFVKKLFWYSLWSLLLAELVVIRWNYSALKDADWMTASVKILLASGILISLFYRLMVYIRPRVFSRYDLFNDRVEIWNGKNCKSIDFDQIAKIKFSWASQRFFGGFTLVLKSGQKFVFSSILENSEKVLEQIRQQRSDLIDTQDFSRYMDLSKWTPHAWDRIKLRLRQAPLILTKLVALPLIMAFTYAFKETQSLWGDEKLSFWWILLICFVLNFLLSMGINQLEEAMASRKFFKDNKRDGDWEKKLFIAATGLHLLLALLITFLITAI